MTRPREPFPILYVADVERSVDFYRNAFGFELGYRWPAEGELEFAFLPLEPLGIGIGRTPEDAEASTGRRFELCLYADDVDAAAECLRALGAREIVPPADQPWGERLTYFEDPDGHRLHITAPLEK